MAENVKGISIILCCYNSSERLPQTLKHIALQQISENLKWEVILVNNNSSDNTVPVAEQIWSQLNMKIPLMVMNEPRAGLTFARQKGIESASYDVLLFCDDDNWLSSNYLENVKTILQENPSIGALGGWCEPVFETTQPDWFDAFKGNFAVGKPTDKSGLLENPNDYIYGAGMVITKQALKKLINKEFKNILTDRKGEALSSGGDIELVYALKLINIPVMFSEQLFFRHFMPENRMTLKYLVKIRQSMYWSNFVLGIYVDALKQKPLRLKYILKKIIKSISYIRDKRSVLKTKRGHKKLFIKNQIETKKLFLSHLYFYYKTRKRLKLLKE